MPLSRNTKVGLVAAGLLLIAGGGTAAVLLRGDRGTPPADTGVAAPAEQPAADVAPEPARRPAGEGTARDDERSVLAHRWWRAKVTRADVGGLVDFIAAAAADATVYVTQDFVYTTNLQSPGLKEPRSSERNGKPKNRLEVRMPAGERADRGGVLRALRARLDEAERRDGPGR